MTATLIHPDDITLEELRERIGERHDQEHTLAGNSEIRQFLPAQKRFMESIALELMYSGAFGAGKSRIGCEKALYLSTMYKQNYGLIARKVFNDIRFSTMEAFFADVVPWELNPVLNPLGAKQNGVQWDKTEHVFTLPEGSRVVFRGLDKPGKIASMNLGWAFIDEAAEISEEDYNMILSRMRYNRVPFHQVFMATNPANINHFLYHKFYLENDPDREVIESNTLENKYLPEHYIKLVSKFTGKYRERYVEGKWVSFEGQIFEVFDPSVHVLSPSDPLVRNGIPHNWPIYRSIDFGFTNPFVCQWWAVDPKSGDSFDTQKKYCIKEIYMSGREVELHARDIMRVSQSFPQTVQATLADWDAGDRAILSRKGIPTVTANKDVSAGIQEVVRQLSDNLIYFFPDEVRLYEIDDNLKDNKKPWNTVVELPGYEWRRLNETDVRGNKYEEPKKKDDHGCDALRMFIYTLSSKGTLGAVRHGVRGDMWGRGQALVGRFESTRDWASMR